MPRTTQLVIPLAPSGAEALGISRVERETGLSKDILRAWERRYGFPSPGRDANGERAYTPDQIDKLRLLRRLTERGLRPGKIIALDLDELENLSLAHEVPNIQSRDLGDYLEALREHDAQMLRRLLSQSLMRKGLDAFVLEVAAPLCDQLAEARLRGDLEDFEVRLCLEQIQGVLHGAMQALQHQGHPPRVIVASTHAESRAIDRLMLEALLSVGGALCIALGSGMASREIAQAAAAHRAQIILVDTPMIDQQAMRTWNHLRALLPPGLAVWAFGRSLARARRIPEGIAVLSDVVQVPSMLQQWRRRHGQ